MPPSETIISHPRVFFIGAGASRPFGKLLMGEFIDSFRSKFPQPISLLEEICKKERDLEFILEQLEVISATAYLYNSSSRGVPTDHISNSPDHFEQTATVLLDELKREIYLHYGSIEHTQNIECYLRLFQHFDTDSTSHVIFTTNYDNAFEYLCEQEDQFNLTDGFAPKPRRREHSWSRRVFDDFRPSIDARDIILFKLHGSANWLKRGDQIIQAPRIYAGNNAEYKHVLIYPAKRKVAIDEPFFTSYDYLEKTLSRADECLVVGYSFRDYDTLMRFKAASLSNPRLRILVLDPRADSIVKTLVSHQIRSVPIPFSFITNEPKYLSELERLLSLAP